MIEADLVQRRGRRERRDVSADAGLDPVRAHDHRNRVPADKALDAALDLLAAGKRHFLLGRQRVDVGRVGAERQPDAAAAGVLAQLLQQLAGSRRAVRLQHVVERIQPLLVSMDSRSAMLSAAIFLIRWLFGGLRAFNLDVLQRGQIGRQLGRPCRKLVELEAHRPRRRWSAAASTCRARRPASSRCTRSKKSPAVRLVQLPRNSRPTSVGPASPPDRSGPWQLVQSLFETASPRLACSSV